MPADRAAGFARTSKMGKGGLNLGDGTVAEYTREEIKNHSTKGDRWIIIDGIVYDVSRWGKKHPGGEKIIANFAGEDATVGTVNVRR